jgi:hypothetical protein
MQDQSQEFEELRRLMALKRHETPPPGYFRDFSSRVITGIELEAARASDSWLSRLAALLQARPAISASFCTATALVLIAATTLFEGDPQEAASGLPRMDQPSSFARLSGPPAPSSAAGLLFVTNLEPAGLALEVAPRATNQFLTDSLFGSPSFMRVEPVSFSR